MIILKNLKYFLICFFTLVFELTAGKYLAVNGTVPMLSFCLCMVVSAKEEREKYIIIISIAMGVFLDLLSPHGFGTNTIIFILSAYVTYTLRDSIFSSKMLFLIIDIFILSVLSCIFYYLFHVLNVRITFGTMLSKIAFPTALYNTVVCALFYLILKFTLYKRR